ncbi:MAG: peptide chain release factor N(5)-glutamine methyltransferase [Clostridia bacterium]|nr:peptide chain release factor N(5)-glutamine methyltransferase [Clostridia bacterium]
MKLSEAVKILADSGIEDSKREARSIFKHFGNFSDSALLLNDPDTDSQEVVKAILKRAERYPLQYIFGSVDFYKESYKVSEACLIPRSDTEILVEEVIKRLPESESFIDICTGSGCIALSTLNNTRGTRAIAVDISEAALDVAKENAENLGLSERVTFICADALSAPLCEDVYAVVSNPPYVTQRAYRDLEKEIFHEPSIAFLGGEDGLVFYKRLIPLYKNAIKESGFIAFEIGYDQGESLKELAEQNRMNAEIIKDYGGNCRVAVLTRKDTEN